MNFSVDIFNVFIPNLVIIAGILVQLILCLIKKNIRFYKSAKWITVGTLLVSLLSLFDVQFEPIYYAFSDSLISNTYTIFMQALILIAGTICVLLTKKTVVSRRNKAFQFYAIYLGAVLSGMLLVTVNDYLTMFLTMEMHLLKAINQKKQLLNIYLQMLLLRQYSCSVFLIYTV